MNNIDKMRKARERPQVGYTAFTLSTRQYSTHLFCFFEGQDHGYYVPRIIRETEEYQCIKCGNKKAVLEVNRMIAGKPEYDKYKVAFFVDRDFNAPIESSKRPIYETPCYSIENFYVCATAFKKIVSNAFSILPLTNAQKDQEIIALYKQRQQEIQGIIALYEQRQQEFHQAVLLFNAWYCCLIDKREVGGELTGVQLEETLPKGFVTISLDRVEQHYTIETLQNTFPNALEVDTATLQAKVQLFQNSTMHEVFRGKYEMEFLIKFIRALLTDSKSKTRQYTSKKIQFSFGDASSINNQQAITIFSSYADTPTELIDYIKARCN